MPTVSVDLDDLESLIFATAAIKAIEQALVSTRRDPFVAPHLARTDAHNRLAEAARHARRSLSGGSTAVPWDEPLTDEEADALKTVFDAEETSKRNGTPPYSVISGDWKAPRANGEKIGIFDRLAAKGAVSIGQLAAGVVWPGAAQAELIPRPEYGIKLTARGRAKYEEWNRRRVIEAGAPSPAKSR